MTTGTSPSPVASWVHLADISAAADHHADIPDVLFLDALRASIVDVAERHNLVIDFVVVTGNLGHVSRAVPQIEYDTTRRWLVELGRSLRLSPESMFVIPGAQDADSNTDDRNTRRLLDELRSGRPIDDAFCHADDFSLLLRRFGAYSEFAANFAPACLDGTDIVHPPQWRWQHRMYARGEVLIRLVGLNTAFLTLQGNDHGILQVGTQPIASVLLDPPLEENEVVVALTHHPLHGNWLRDEQQAGAWLRARASLLLSALSSTGNVCEEIRTGSLPDSTDIRLSSGSSRNGESLGYKYNIASLVKTSDETLGLRIYPQAWSTQTKSFRVDVDSTPNGALFSEHNLGIRRTRRGRQYSPKPMRSLTGIPQNLPDPFDCTRLSLKDIAAGILRDVGQKVEMLLRVGDRLYIWIVAPEGGFALTDLGRVKLSVACLVADMPGVNTIEVGSCDTKTIVNTAGDLSVGMVRVAFKATDVSNATRTKSLPPTFWTQVPVLITANENTPFMETLTLPMADFTRGVVDESPNEDSPHNPPSAAPSGAAADERLSDKASPRERVELHLLSDDDTDAAVVPHEAIKRLTLRSASSSIEDLDCVIETRDEVVCSLVGTGLIADVTFFANDVVIHKHRMKMDYVERARKTLDGPAIIRLQARAVCSPLLDGGCRMDYEGPLPQLLDEICSLHEIRARVLSPENSSFAVGAWVDVESAYGALRLISICLDMLVRCNWDGEVVFVSREKLLEQIREAPRAQITKDNITGYTSKEGLPLRRLKSP